MLKELFESVVTLAHKSKDPEQPQIISELSSNDRRRIAFVYDGKITEKELAPDPRQHRATSAGDLVTLVQVCATAENPLIFVGPEDVVALVDAERRERISLKLTTSAHYQTLRTLPKPLGQREAINLLRRQLHGTGLENYADAFRQVVFERNQQAAGKVQRDNESMGRAIEARVTGTQDLPEFLRGDISVFDPSVYRAVVPICVGVDTRLTEELFDLWIPPNALDEALQAAVSQLVDYLSTELPESTVVRGVE